MKKLFYVFLTASLILILAACGNDKSDDNKTSKSDDKTITVGAYKNNTKRSLRK